MGDVEQWVGALATLLVGALAGAIAWLQYRNSVFRPDVEVAAEAEPDTNGRQNVAIRVVNRGGAPGSIERIQLLDGRHHRVAVAWKSPWSDTNPPLPFLLPGKASAILVLQQPKMLGDDVKVKIIYGDRKDRGCTDIHRARGVLLEYTALPPGSLGITTPDK